PPAGPDGPGRAPGRALDHALDEALRSIAVPDLEPVDVQGIVAQPRLPAYLLPAWVWVTAVLVSLLLVAHLVGLDLRWGLRVTVHAMWILLAGLLREGPYGLSGAVERALWLSGLALAGCGLAGVVVATIVDRVEPQRLRGRSR
ncbi:MAG: hypothetical protein Q8P50_17500, partial [Bacillota bacterium]|nr:hypothetical protein [Bacillota bacterium]